MGFSRLSLLHSPSSVRIPAWLRSTQGAKQGGKDTVSSGRRDRVGPLCTQMGKLYEGNPGCGGAVEFRAELKSQFSKIRIYPGHADAKTPSDRSQVIVRWPSLRCVQFELDTGIQDSPARRTLTGLRPEPQTTAPRMTQAFRVFFPPIAKQTCCSELPMTSSAPRSPLSARRNPARDSGEVTGEPQDCRPLGWRLEISAENLCVVHFSRTSEPIKRDGPRVANASLYM